MVDVIKQTLIHNYFSVILGILIVFVDGFFTFWLLQKGLEGKLFYAITMALGLYLIIEGIILKKKNYLVVTNERIIDIQKESIFTETQSTISFLDLGDVVVERKGLMAAILNYGAVTIHPKDGKFKLEVHRIPKPSMVQNFLLEKRDQASRSNTYLNNATLLKQVIKAVPDMSEAELTLLYERVNTQLSKILKNQDGEQKE